MKFSRLNIFKIHVLWKKSFNFSSNVLNISELWSQPKCQMTSKLHFGNLKKFEKFQNFQKKMKLFAKTQKSTSNRKHTHDQLNIDGIIKKKTKNISENVRKNLQDRIDVKTQTSKNSWVAEKYSFEKMPHANVSHTATFLYPLSYITYKQKYIGNMTTKSFITL